MIMRDTLQSCLCVTHLHTLDNLIIIDSILCQKVSFLPLLTLAEWLINWVNSFHPLIGVRKQKQELCHLRLASAWVGSGALRVMLENRGCDEPAGWCARVRLLQGCSLQLLQAGVHMKSLNCLEKISASMWSTTVSYLRTSNTFTQLWVIRLMRQIYGIRKKGPRRREKEQMG